MSNFSCNNKKNYVYIDVKNRKGLYCCKKYAVFHFTLNVKTMSIPKIYELEPEMESF